jgi:hypothetical protein
MRRSADFRRRSETARKGWRTRRRNERKRSEAARKGWETRRQTRKGSAKRMGVRPGHPSKSPVVITRFDYKNSKGKIMNFEIHSRNGEVFKVKVGPYEYTKAADLEALSGVLEKAPIPGKR